MKKILALLLALCMILALAACGETAPAPASQNETPAEEPAAEAETPAEEPAAEEPAAKEPDTRLAAEAWEYDPANYYDDSAAVYDSILGEYYEYYEQALATSNVS